MLFTHPQPSILYFQHPPICPQHGARRENSFLHLRFLFKKIDNRSQRCSECSVIRLHKDQKGIAAASSHTQLKEVVGAAVLNTTGKRLLA